MDMFFYYFKAQHIFNRMLADILNATKELDAQQHYDSASNAYKATTL